mmetsp:Transcript_7856/g.10044  ORF Transcript_7856/g.10044 Transcript_7856/m.10044 type:complete len:80 (+) Transcript_7856:1506-1745(+)
MQNRSRRRLTIGGTTSDDVTEVKNIQSEITSKSLANDVRVEIAESFLSWLCHLINLDGYFHWMNALIAIFFENGFWAFG